MKRSSGGRGLTKHKRCHSPTKQKKREKISKDALKKTLYWKSSNIQTLSILSYAQSKIVTWSIKEIFARQIHHREQIFEQHFWLAEEWRCVWRTWILYFRSSRTNYAYKKLQSQYNENEHQCFLQNLLLFSRKYPTHSKRLPCFG